MIETVSRLKTKKCMTVMKSNLNMPIMMRTIMIMTAAYPINRRKLLSRQCTLYLQMSYMKRYYSFIVNLKGIMTVYWQMVGNKW